MSDLPVLASLTERRVGPILNDNRENALLA